jgi:hypothetical protein
VKLLCSLLFAIVLPALLCAQTPPDSSPVYALRRATVLAFFVGADHAPEIDSNGNETLSDFQLYAYQAKGPLKRMGIDLLDTIAPVFRVRLAAKETTLRPTQKVGYYFLAPGKEPRVEYGVRTDDQLIDIAREYFGAKPAKQKSPTDLSQ